MIILFHSPKGGVGSSTVAGNIALMFAQRGDFVTAIDLTGQGALALCLGDDTGAVDRRAAAEDGAPVIMSGVRLLSIADDRPVSEIVASITAHNREDSVVIVDVASADRQLLGVLLADADLRICVLTPDPGALAALPLVFGGTRETQADRTVFLLNRSDDRLRLGRDIAAMLRGLLGDRLLGTIRRDEAVNEALAMMETLGSYAPASAALADFAKITDLLVKRETGNGDLPLRGAA